MKRLLLAGAAAFALCAASAAYADDESDANKAQPTDVSSEFAKAHDLRVAGQLPEAASALAQLMLAAPDDARVVGEYGKVMAEEKRADDALAFLKRAVELTQTDWSLYSALGVAYNENNDPKNADMAYQRALALNPGEPTVLNNYAMSKMLAGDLAGAQMLFAQARASGNPKIINNAAMLAEMEAAHPALASRPAPVKTAAVQKPVPAPAPFTLKPLPPVSPSSVGTPRNLLAANAPAPTPGTALAHNPNVVMQAVPKDPLAGPVKPKVTAPHRTAVAAKAPAAPAPALRTAADTH
jgi:Flp pilus assembly protein TadD